MQSTSGSPLLDAVPALHLGRRAWGFRFEGQGVRGLGFGVVKGFGVVWDFAGFDLRVKGLGL